MFRGLDQVSAHMAVHPESPWCDSLGVHGPYRLAEEAIAVLRRVCLRRKATAVKQHL